MTSSEQNVRRSTSGWGWAGAAALGICSWATATAGVPCDQAASALSSAPASERLSVALSVLESDCQPLLPGISTAIESRSWADGTPLSADDRVALLNAAVAGGYDEAIAVSVRVLETGTWPGNQPIALSEGARVAEGLGPALDDYRILLLLDVYEQVVVPDVRLSVLRALRSAKSDNALLPALDAYWTEGGQVQALASEVVASQPEGTAEGLLVRLARDLPPGPVLDWAKRLGMAHGIDAAVKAAKRD